jgi:mono/diheme cytochrome c family protein
VKRRPGGAIAALTSAVAIGLAGCDNMANQPKLNPYEVPYDSQAERPVTPPPHVVARDEPLHPPPAPPVNMALLERGRQRFDIYCAPCHGRFGDGNGMIVQRGFPRPPSYYSDALRNAPSQHFYDVISRGHGVMFSYADRVEPSDRWAIVAYIRALQASARATVADVPAGQRKALQ